MADVNSTVDFPPKDFGSLAATGATKSWEITLSGRSYGVVEFSTRDSALGFKISTDSAFANFTVVPAGGSIRRPLGPGASTYYFQQLTAGVTVSAAVVG